MIHVITYDLHNPGRDYDAVVETIKGARSWAHPQGSVWLVDTALTPSEWVDRLRAAGDANDEYFVLRIRQNWSSINMDAKVVDWLKSPSRDW